MGTKKTYKVNESGLIADKELFRIWFEFYKLALVCKDTKVQSALRKTKKFYSEWGTDTEVHFDDWWITHCHLFVETDSVRLMNGTERTDKTHLYIVVPRTRSINVAVQEFEELLKAEFKATRTKRTHVPIHRFAPTEVQGFKRETMRLTLDLMKNVFIDESLKSDALYQKVEDYLQKDRYKKQKNEIPKLFEDMTSGNEDAKRNIRRYRSRGKKILLNVASGKFP